MCYMDNLIRARRAAHMTQKDVAKQMGTTNTAISRLEKGKGSARIVTLEWYAAAVGCKLDVRLIKIPTEIKESRYPPKPGERNPDLLGPSNKEVLS